MTTPAPAPHDGIAATAADLIPRSTGHWPVGPSAFRRAFRGHPAGVVVITLDAGNGPVGFTATSLASLSAEPPLVSFGINARSSSWPHVRDGRTAVVHFLDARHQPVAATFATSGIDRFAATAWRRLATGEPVLAEHAGWLRVRFRHQIPAGDSRLVIAHVEEARLAEAVTTSPLLYHDGAYHSL
ncbi:flavin reductase family protein [Nocardioides humi]|uniref:Flavin reductase family protein n=1 Tax=Nocardioides humi TaxID=449461 RepID=A0ABN2AFA8_9ACTN|nr:flavin reductase family protein [Nocardioides humi]